MAAEGPLSTPEEVFRMLDGMGEEGRRLATQLRTALEGHREWLHENMRPLIAQGDEAIAAWASADPVTMPPAAWNQIVGIALSLASFLSTRQGEAQLFDRLFRAVLAAYQIGRVECGAARPEIPSGET